MTPSTTSIKTILNPGNFIEILKYGARCGNVIDLLFKDCPSNQTYRSKTIQNEIIEICGELITENLVKEIKKAKYFSVLADEATDSSNVEQLAIVLRFVDDIQQESHLCTLRLSCFESLHGSFLQTPVCP